MAGLALLVGGAEMLVRGASALTFFLALDGRIGLTVAAVACLPIFFTGHRISRWEGWLFLAYYAAYTAFLILAAAEHDALRAFSATMGLFVVPLTAVTLLVLVVRGYRAGDRGRPEEGR